MTPIGEALGSRAARDLSALVGGRTLRIPTWSSHPLAVQARANLVRLVGVRFAEDLITHFARSKVYFPNGGNVLNNSRGKPIDHRVVARLTKRGFTASTIAERLGCSERTVHAKRAKARASRKAKRS